MWLFFNRNLFIKTDADWMWHIDVACQPYPAALRNSPSLDMTRIRIIEQLSVFATVLIYIWRRSSILYVRWPQQNLLKIKLIWIFYFFLLNFNHGFLLNILSQTSYITYQNISYVIAQLSEMNRETQKLSWKVS